MKGLIFGNSHVAAIRLVGDIGNSHDVDFYAVGGGHGPHVKLEGGRIYPNKKNAIVHSTIEGVREEGLDVSGYDYIAFCSLGFGAVRATNKRIPLLHLSLAECAQSEIEDTLPVSQNVMKQVLRDWFYQMPALAALKLLKLQFEGRILCAPTPIPAVSLLEENHPLRRVYGSSVTDFVTWFSEAEADLVREFTDRSKIEYLDYPDQTWLSSGSTPKEYALPTDLWHMNGTYGRLVLDQIEASNNVGTL